MDDLPSIIQASPNGRIPNENRRRSRRVPIRLRAVAEARWGSWFDGQGSTFRERVCGM